MTSWLAFAKRDAPYNFWNNICSNSLSLLLTHGIWRLLKFQGHLAFLLESKCCQCKSANTKFGCLQVICLTTPKFMLESVSEGCFHSFEQISYVSPIWKNPTCLFTLLPAPFKIVVSRTSPLKFYVAQFFLPCGVRSNLAGLRTRRLELCGHNCSI